MTQPPKMAFCSRTYTPRLGAYSEPCRARGMRQSWNSSSSCESFEPNVVLSRVATFCKGKTRAPWTGDWTVPHGASCMGCAADSVLITTACADSRPGPQRSQWKAVGAWLGVWWQRRKFSRPASYRDGSSAYRASNSASSLAASDLCCFASAGLSSRALAMSIARCIVDRWSSVLLRRLLTRICIAGGGWEAKTAVRRASRRLERTASAASGLMGNLSPPVSSVALYASIRRPIMTFPAAAPRMQADGPSTGSPSTGSGCSTWSTTRGPFTSNEAKHGDPASLRDTALWPSSVPIHIGTRRVSLPPRFASRNDTRIVASAVRSDCPSVRAPTANLPSSCGESRCSPKASTRVFRCMLAIDGLLLLVRCRFGSPTPPDLDERGGARAPASRDMRFRCTSMDRGVACRLGRLSKLKNMPLRSTAEFATLNVRSSSSSTSDVADPTTSDAEPVVARSPAPFGGSRCFRSKPSPSAGASPVIGNDIFCTLGSGSATISLAVTPFDPSSCTPWKSATSCQESRHLHCGKGHWLGKIERGNAACG